MISILLNFYLFCYIYFRCLILRMNGELSVLDMDDGHEQSLTNSVELFWVTCSQYEEKGNLIKEVSWLDYGHKGMQVSFIVFFFIIFKELCLSLLIDRTSFHILLSFYPTLLFFFFGRCGTHPMEKILLNKKISCRYRFCIL